MSTDTEIRALQTVAGLYKGQIHGVDRRGDVDVEFPDARQAVSFAAEFMEHTTMRQTWAPGVDGLFIQLQKPVVLTFPLPVFTNSLEI